MQIADSLWNLRAASTASLLGWAQTEQQGRWAQQRSTLQSKLLGAFVVIVGFSSGLARWSSPRCHGYGSVARYPRPDCAAPPSHAPPATSRSRRKRRTPRCRRCPCPVALPLASRGLRSECSRRSGAPSWSYVLHLQRHLDALVSCSTPSLTFVAVADLAVVEDHAGPWP